MKLRNYFIGFILFFIGFVGFAQTPNSLLEDPSNKIKMDFKKINTSKNQKASVSKTSSKEPCLIDPSTGDCIELDPCADCDGLCNQITGECFEIIDPPPGGTTSSGYAGTTPGEFAVSLSGAATYNVPINLPPGIKDVAPNIGISFSSQASNGLAGWGWNVTGLSTITRIPATKHHDGLIDPVDFDSSDRFALDGQRLMIKSGSYGSSGSEYQTENYSNIKIKAYGTSPYGSSYGPSYFIVFYPDGTRAWYGNGGSSRGRLEWALYKRQDPQGNYIEYNYSQSNNLLRINRIKYGSRTGTTPPNDIYFYYKTRTRPELSYIKGLTFKRTNILDRIEVKGGNQLYRKYQLSHNTTSLGYQRVSSIREYNSANQSFPAITFTYESSSSGVTRDGNTLDIYPGINYNSDALAVGEFNGDGKMDFITYNKNARNELNVFMDIFDDYGSGISIGYSVNVEKFDQVFASTILSWNGKILSQQGVTNVRETVNSSNSTARFRTFAMAAYGPVLQYDKFVNFPIGPVGDFDCDPPSNNDYRKIPKSYISGDFNGDGLTDVLAIPKKYYREVCEWEYDYWDDYDECVCGNETVSQGNSEVYFVDLKRTASTTAVNIGSLAHRIQDSTDKLFGVDFDGDGKTDLMHIRDGLVRVYSMNASNQLVQIAYLSNSYIDEDKPILLGDYNGDGKTDFAQPSANNSSTWRFYLSRGNNIYYYSKNIGVTYTENYVDTDHPWYNPIEIVNGVPMENPLYEYHYIAQDYNGDGKSDILKHEVVSPYSSYNVVSDRLMLYTNTHNSNESTPSFQLTTNSLATNNGVTKFGIPLFLEAKATNSNLEYAYIDGNNVHTYVFNRDNKKDTSLNKITNNGVVTDIFYERIGEDDGLPYPSNTYSPDYDENYPFVNINIAPSFKVVKEAKNTGSGYVQRQLFQYLGAVSHAEGLGFLGFKEFKKTNWFGDGVAQLWNVSKHDMQKRGAVTQQWVSTSPSSYPSSNFANRSTYTYSTQLLSNKVFINMPTQIQKEDGLQNISSTESYTYDSYKNPLSISTTFTGGSKTISYLYSHNISATNEYYHIGRPTKRTETSTLNGNTFNSEVQLTYNNNLVTQTKKKGNGTPWLTENFLYDVFGNTTRKTISGTGITNRVEEFDYDSSGRYMTKSTDVLGLETTHLYNATLGVLTSSTSPYGQTTSYEYDAWQRLLKETNYLGKETKYAYNTENVSGLGLCLTKSIDYPEGQDEKIYYNSFGWVVQNKKLSLNNKWVQKRFEYNAAGRQTRESEPYFSTGSATQWNQVYYDQYGRPISNTLFNGKVINTSYNGLSATVDDGTKTVTTTKDAVGNITTLQDLGGTITYQYHGNGAMKSANYGSHVVSVTIDGWGRKASLTDSSAGTYSYQYNILGEVLEETTPKGTTTYTYDALGRLNTKTVDGDETDLTLNYVYDGTTKLLNVINGSNNRSDTYSSYTYNYYYDTYKRLSRIQETTETGNFEKRLTFDPFGRIESENYISNHLGSGTNSDVKVKNIYDAAGVRTEIRDFSSNNLIWKINDENARGQALNIELGNGIVKTKQYDQYGFLTHILDKEDAGTGSAQALKMDYSFDAQRGILNSRKNYGFSNWNESFTHDNLDRLTQVDAPVSNVKEYDDRGRITNNSSIGDYNYASSNMYQLADIDLNNQGDIYYQQHNLQQITYNAFKKPIEISENEKGRVSFEYGPLMKRNHAFYGGLQEDKTQRQYHKQYSSIVPVEMVHDNINGSTKIITYIAGNAYTAPLAYIKTSGMSGGTDIDEYVYLHRDYLGSILAISDSSANILEERQFGAWGKTDAFKKDNELAEFSHDSLIGRGFTGHEHFFEVSLIHMNGRMYDAQLGRFLSPDSYIQDPYNSQNFNRYGYVWNNPLTHIDPSGEIFWAIVGVAALIGATAGAAAYIINAAITGDWSWGGFAMSVLGGALTGALGGIAAPGMFPAVMSMGQFWGFVAAGVASSFLPAVSIPIGDFSFSLSPSIAFGTGGFNFGLSGSVGYKSKGFSFSVGGSIGKGGSNIGGGFTIYDNKNGQAFSLGATLYGGKHSQGNWFIGYQRGDFSFKMTNDAFLSGDEYRTAAAEVGIGNYSFGFNLYTSEPPSNEYNGEYTIDGKDDTRDKTYESPIWGKNKHYTYSSGSRIFAGMYFGYRDKDKTYRLGFNGAFVQDLFQNGIHRHVITGPYFNTNYGSPDNLFFQFYRNRNPWSLYSK
ncbi:RHS repeat-associated core domain-containing protein [uncultured Psychroserpens sp.]|uniref:RHS repeat-associated core domain-containing protein n=1 Tax=uncultured Psychroserpens sp. TaxID=255436 RepID=UPI0026320B81|nr:RHS repeat-associated core domain-containing protein [uncultured Psychroserpens sp.]